MSRPSDYTPEIAAEICSRLAGGDSLRTVCEAADMPNRSTVFRWLAAQAVFRDQYARAREAQADAMAEELLAIADTPQEGHRHEEGTTEKQGAYEKTVREDMLGHRRLQVDARKFLMVKLAPKKYGDRLQHVGDENAPLVTEIRRTLVDPRNPDGSSVPPATESGTI